MSYDPLHSISPGEGLDHVDSYWAATAGPSPGDDGRLQSPIETDVAIIGGGYTGLSCAFHLAKRYGVRPVVLEANRPVWGCSGRNGSFAGPALGRVSLSEWTARWGEVGARSLWAEAVSAVETVRSLIKEGNIDCDVQPDGRMRVAHAHSTVKKLEEDASVLRSFGTEFQMLTPSEIGEKHFKGKEAHAALRTTYGFVLHPMKLGYGILRMAREAGATVHSASPVLHWSKHGQTHCLDTPDGKVYAKRIVFATNGYTNERLHPTLDSRLLPVLSNIVVTRPMTEAEIGESNFVTTDSISDTRKFLNYFRRLPDGRVMLGSRGPIRESGSAPHRDRLLQIIRRKFPALHSISADYFWGGWVALTPDYMPHVGHAEDDATTFYAMGYCGSGVTAANQAGRRLAEYLGESKAVPVQLNVQPPRYPLARFRRVGQVAAFQWYSLSDALT